MGWQFHLRIGFTLLCVFFAIVFCALGIWQFHRYEYKKLLLSAYEQRVKESPKPLLTLLSNASADTLQFQSISTHGKYLNHLTILIQNKIYHGQPGFEVLTPFQVAGDKKWLLIDRGWVAQLDNHISTHILPVRGDQTIKGYIKLVDQPQFILGKNVLKPNVYPLVVQKIDLAELSHLLQNELYPFVVRLQSPVSHGFIRDWIVTSVLPERHMGYAIQWIAMAIALLIAYFCFSFEKVKRVEK